MAPRHLLRKTLSTMALAPILSLTSLSPAAALEDPIVNDPAVAAPEPDLFASACPELTDSVKRLYSAFFGRLPDADGWEYWMSVYVAPNTNLETIANDFVMSDEFQATYGTLSNGEFVTLVYNNVMGRTPDAEGLAHWTTSLDNGYSRGAVMIAFSESAEYVAITDTWPPLAGFLQWYGNPVQFACGTGPVTVTPDWNAAYADLMIWSEAADPIDYSMGFNTPNGQVMEQVTQLSPSSYSIFWNMEIRLIDAQSMIVDLPERNDIFWTAVFYDESHGVSRAPYTDGFGVFARTADDAADESSLLSTVSGEGALGFADWTR